MITNETKQEYIAALQLYLHELTVGAVTPMPENGTWEARMERISTSREPYQIDEETYSWLLEAHPMRFTEGSYDCFAERGEPSRLLWRRDGRYFIRQLNRSQTNKLSLRAGTATLYR